MAKHLIIGASHGIGAEVARKLKSENHEIWSASRTRRETPEGAFWQKWDVTDAGAQLENLPDELQGLVYCPGTINLKPFNRLKDEDFQKDLEVNVLGAVRAIRQALRPLKKGKGSIVLFSTVAVERGMSFHASVATAKAALEGLGRSLAAELAPSGVRVNLIAPSLTDTPLAENLLANDAKREAGAKRHPLGRVGTAEDIASAACYLLSEQAGWITGQVWGVDGGLSRI